MYRFRTTFELSPIQIKDYMKVYEKNISRPLVLAEIFTIIVCIFVSIYFFFIKLHILKGAICILCAAIIFLVVTIIRLVILEVLWQKEPFAIGPYVTLELDEFFHVNCSGQMKSYMKGTLKKKVMKNGDYILYKKKDMIIIPYNVLTNHIRSEIDNYF